MKLKLYFFIGLMTIASSAFAGESLSDDDALREAQELLRNPEQRNAAIKGDKRAEQADKWAKDLMGENTQDLYGLSADLLENIVKRTGGDPQKMEALLKEASRDPAAFYQTFSAEQKKKVSELAIKAKVDKSSKP